MSLPEVVARDEWVAARKRLLVREKELTRARDALNAERRRLPMVAIDKEYTFDGPEGRVTLLDLFEGRPQLIIQHFMFDPRWDAGCPMCRASADELSNGLLEHLRNRNTSFAMVARAPLAKIERYRTVRGWTFPWYSSYPSDFNFDFHVTLDASVRPIEYNYRTADEHHEAGTSYYVSGEEPIERSGLSCFLSDGGRVFHTYSAFGRGGEAILGTYQWLDLTALGRQEKWEEPKGRVTEARPAGPDFTTALPSARESKPTQR